MLRIEDLTANELKSKLLKVLTNPSYRNKMAIRSRLLRDQPKKPIKSSCIWWMEYMLRNSDASHLRTLTIELGFIRSNCLDLCAILYSFVMLALFFALYFLVKLYRLCGGSGISTGNKKIKTN